MEPYQLYASNTEPSGYSPSVLDPTLMAPSGGAYSPGTSFGGGISFYGGSGGTTGGYASPGTVSMYRPPTTTTTPYYGGGGTATASPAPFPSAPGTPGGSASESPPALNPLAAAGGATGIGAPHHASPAGLQPLNNNPYAASLRAYAAPVSPLAGIRAADQSHGGPTLQGGAQQAITSNGLDSTPVGVPPSFAGASGFHGGIGNMPPTQAPAPPLSHVPFSAMVAYNGNGGNQGAGTANRDNLQAQSPTRGQGLQQSPAPPLFKPPPKNVMVPPPPPVAVPLGNPAIAAGMPGQPQMPVDPNMLKLDLGTDSILQAIVKNVNRSLANEGVFKQFIKDGLKRLDEVTEPFVASQVVGPQREVDMYESPLATGTGLSLLEQAAEINKDAIDARSRMQDIHAGRHNLSYQNKARLAVQDALDTNAKYAGGPFPEIQESRRNEILQGMAHLPSLYYTAEMKAEKDRETDALEKSQHILNGYHAALVNKATAWTKAIEMVDARENAFFRRIDEARKSMANLDQSVQTNIQTYASILENQRVKEHQKIIEDLQLQANSIAALKVQADLQLRNKALMETTINNKQAQLKDLLTKKAASGNKDAVQEQILRLQGEIGALQEQQRLTNK